MASPLSDPAAGNRAGWGVLPGAGSATAPQPVTSFVQAFVGGDGRIDALERYGTLAARILIGQIFFLSGVMKVMDPAGTAEQMAGRGMFWIPFFLWSAAAVELGGGLSLFLGYKARLGALLLFLFLIPVTLTFHNWWTYPPEEQKVQMLFFLHNLTLLGGLVLVMTVGPGPLSFGLKGRRA
jgi:putative oxidoreductase